VRSRLSFWKYPISIVLLLLVIAAFTLIYNLSETATAPYEPVETPDPVIIETPDKEEEPTPLEEPDDEPEDEPEIIRDDVPQYIPPEDDFITLHMDAADIHRGYLLLINHDHDFSIPDDLDLVNINDTKTTAFRVQHTDSRLARSIMEPLDRMMEDFITATNMRSVAIISAFRTLGNQESILNNYIRLMGRREALRWAALPGHSEHHTGLAFDFGVMHGNSRSTFTGTGNTAWFRRNSHEYGFIHRYQQGKSHITQTAHEPWHFRFVGLPHSTIMVLNNWCLEEYHEMIRDYTYDDPFEIEIDGITYAIFFALGTEVRIPLDSEFDISGNNVDGFIVTTTRIEYDPDEINDVSI